MACYSFGKLKALMNVTRRELLAACAISSLTQGAAAQRRPNVILILSDDQGFGDLSLHGNPILQTPNLDRIGREGVEFTVYDKCRVEPKDSSYARRSRASCSSC